VMYAPPIQQPMMNVMPVQQQQGRGRGGRHGGRGGGRGRGRTSQGWQGAWGGGQITFGHCDSPAALWIYSQVTNEIISNDLPEGSVCMTTGWPFLQIGAFETPKGESAKTVIVLNEAKDSANYVLYDGDDLILSGSIPPRSIQTLLLD
jgi:glucosylceramidase